MFFFDSLAFVLDSLESEGRPSFDVESSILEAEEALKLAILRQREELSDRRYVFEFEIKAVHLFQLTMFPRFALSIIHGQQITLTK